MSNILKKSYKKYIFKTSNNYIFFSYKNIIYDIYIINKYSFHLTENSIIVYIEHSIYNKINFQYKI